MQWSSTLTSESYYSVQMSSCYPSVPRLPTSSLVSMLLVENDKQNSQRPCIDSLAQSSSQVWHRWLPFLPNFSQIFPNTLRTFSLITDFS